MPNRRIQYSDQEPDIYSVTPAVYSLKGSLCKIEGKLEKAARRESCRNPKTIDWASTDITQKTHEMDAKDFNNNTKRHASRKCPKKIDFVIPCGEFEQGSVNSRRNIGRLPPLKGVPQGSQLRPWLNMNKVNLGVNAEDLMPPRENANLTSRFTYKDKGEYCAAFRSFGKKTTPNFDSMNNSPPLLFPSLVKGPDTRKDSCCSQKAENSVFKLPNIVGNSCLVYRPRNQSCRANAKNTDTQPWTSPEVPSNKSRQKRVRNLSNF